MGTRSERYHSSWVLLLCGAAYSWPFQIAVCSAGASVPFTTDALALPVHGRIQPAWANSAAQVTSSDHDVDGAVVRREPPDQLLALAV